MLYIVATPIGNLEDITLRALRTLRGVDFIICEDTRVTTKLLAHYEIKKPLISYHHHSKLDKINYIIERLEKGENAALVSDAGTPGINDPGGILISKILEKNYENKNCAHDIETQDIASLRGNTPLTPLKRGTVRIIPIPGPCAATALASVSGIPMDRFLFMGFPPHKKGRQTFFKSILEREEPVIFYESCHRILKALSELNELSVNKNSVQGKNPPVSPFSKGGGLQIIVGRELTKMFETIYRGDVENVINQLESNKNNLKGEFAVIVNKTTKQEIIKINENIVKLGSAA
ncbi:MAG: ribosomal RNA small subunit methyltransferase I [bacterium]